MQKERKAMAVEMFPMGSVPTVMEFGHWSRECPNMVNQIGKNEPVAPNQATSSTAPGVKLPARLQFEGFANLEVPVPSSGPSSPISPVSFSGSEVRMVLFHDLAHEWTQVSNNDADQKWVISYFGQWFRC